MKILRPVLATLTALILVAPARADDWPQWRGPARDGVWRETGLIERFPGPELKPAWRVPVGSGYSGPTVAAGRVYVTDRLVEPRSIERVLCFDARTGKELWKHEYERNYVGVGYAAGPRTSVLVADGRAYALGAMGDLFAFDAATGAVLWKHDCNAEFEIDMPIWGVSASPLLEQGKLICQIGGSDGSCVVAFDAVTGKLAWRALNERAGYSAPIVVEQAGRRVVVVWTGDSVAGLDPTNGSLLWHVPWAPRNMPIGIATPVVSRGRVFLTSFYDGSLMLGLDDARPAATTLWKRVGASERATDALHSIIATPVFVGDHLYGVDSYGELRCLDARTGDRLWEDKTATPPARWSNIHITPNGDKYWMFNERGELLIARLTPAGFEELSRTKVIEPTLEQLRQRNGVCWSHPAYADRAIFVRNDEALLRCNLGQE